MKSFRALMILLLLARAGLQGCYKDILSPGADPNGPPQQVSFSGDLLPILTKNCALSGCHVCFPPLLSPGEIHYGNAF